MNRVTPVVTTHAALGGGRPFLEAAHKSRAVFGCRKKGSARREQPVSPTARSARVKRCRSPPPRISSAAAAAGVFRGGTRRSSLCCFGRLPGAVFEHADQISYVNGPGVTRGQQPARRRRDARLVPRIAGSGSAFRPKRARATQAGFGRPVPARVGWCERPRPFLRVVHASVSFLGIGFVSVRRQALPFDLNGSLSIGCRLSNATDFAHY